MNEEIKTRLIKIGTPTVLAIIILVPLLAFIIHLNSGYTPRSTAIDNIYNELPDITSSAVQATKQKLYTQLATDLTNTAIPTSGAIVRNGSAITFPTTNNMISGAFIIDVPVVERSYLANYYYYDYSQNEESNDNSDVILFCLANNSQIIYPNSDCSHTSNIPDQNTLWSYISSYTTALPGTDISTTFSFTGPSTVSLAIQSCDKQSSKDLAITVARQWLVTLGFDPNLFTFQIDSNYNNCLTR